MVQVNLPHKNNNVVSSSSSRHRLLRLARIATTVLAVVGVISNVAFNVGLHRRSEEVRRAAAVAVQGEYQHGSRLLHYRKPSRRFKRTPFTLDEFVVNGVNLAQYGLEDNRHFSGNFLTEPYQLYDNFYIGDLIHGEESWLDLVHYHRDLQHPSLIFYMDKISQKRWMQAKGYPMPRSFVLNYQHELGITPTVLETDKTLEEQVVSNLLPTQKSYVVKPTHKSCSSGVWLVRYDQDTRKQTMGYSGHPTDRPFDKQQIAHRIVQDLHGKAADMESWALKHVQPGFVVEERYSAADTDTKAAYEFKTFTVWGKVYFGYLKRGSGDYMGLVYRNGTMITQCQHHNVDWTTIPDWLQWDKVVELAEHLAQHKDMFRADIFVGLPSGSPELHKTQSQNVLSSMQLAISETEFHPTSSFKDKGILEEAARLWMAGYKMRIYDLIPNDEVPQEFLKNGYYLSEADAASLQLSYASNGQTWQSTL